MTAPEAPAPKAVEPAPPEPRPVERAPAAELQAPTSHLSVLVQAPSGGTFSGAARFELRPLTGELQAAFELSAANPRAELDCPPREYRLTLVPPGPDGWTALPARFALRAGASRLVNVALVPAWRVKGTLADAEGQGHADVPVVLEHQGTVLAETRSRADGRFGFEHLAEGDYVLVVGDRLGPLLPRQKLHVDGALAELELVLPPLLTLEVRVLDEHGLAVAGARVEGRGEAAGRVAGETDADGRLQASSLPPGNYRLFATHPTLGRGNQIFALSAELPQPLEIHLLTGRPAR